MGGFESKEKRKRGASSREKYEEELRRKIRQQQEKINEIMCFRKSETEAYEREMMGFVVKEMEWKRERKRLKEEVKRLRVKLQYKMKWEEIRELDGDVDEKVMNMNINYLMEQMREERAWQDEALEKWKSLYMSIKLELDHLISRTNQGEKMWRRAEEEELMEEVEREIKGKEEIIENLKAKLVSMEQEESRWEREVDILRQSLRIMTHANKSKHTTKTKTKTKNNQLH